MTFDQAADCDEALPDRATCRPWAKLVWLLLSSEAVPQLPLIWVHADVVTETVEPVVLTEMPESAAAGAASARVSAAAAAAVGPERNTDVE